MASAPIASAAVPMVGDSVSAPDNMPAAKPGSRPSWRATPQAVSSPTTGMNTASAAKRQPSPFMALKNLGPTS